MAVTFIRIAVIYIAVGATLGIIMGIKGDFTLAPVHAHINLLGFATLAIAGLIYRAFPAAATTRLARVNFWLHNHALPEFMIILGCMLSGNVAWLPVVIVSSLAVLLGLYVFGVNVWMSIKAGD
jgi:hypothetical protein